MNRTQALEWLVENVTKWPVKISQEPCPANPIGWYWYENVNVLLINDTESDSITQQDWLDATDNMKEKCDE